MILPEFVNAIDLHDSSVVDIRFLPGAGELEVTVKLLMWRQLNYREGVDPEIVLQPFVCKGVRSLGLRAYGGGDLAHWEIRDVAISEVETGGGAYRIALLLGTFEPGRSEACLEFTASEVTTSAGTPLIDK